jgi:hypothetical protein
VLLQEVFAGIMIFMANVLLISVTLLMEDIMDKNGRWGKSSGVFVLSQTPRTAKKIALGNFF